MDRDTRAAALQWLTRNDAGIVVEVAEALGSAPREAGTRMLVGADRCIGTIGGGHLELKAIELAREMLTAPAMPPRSQRYALGPSLGQCCGGAVTLHFERLDAAALARWPAQPPLLELQLYGAGHVGRAIASLLTTLDVRVVWIDEREQEFPPTTTLGSPWPAHIEQRCVDAAETEVAQATAGAHHLVLTHSHELDLRITEAILRRGDFGFLGLIGSKTKRERFVRRFEARGIAPEVIARLICPIGIDGIVGKQPEVIAVAAVAQVLRWAASDSAS